VVVLLAKLFIKRTDERPSFLVLPIVVFTFLDVLDLDVHRDPFGHELYLMAEAFDQHTGMAFDLLDSFIQSLFLPFETLVDYFKASVNCIESSIEPLLLPVQAFL
jgi:hypothetical protein